MKHWICTIACLCCCFLFVSGQIDFSPAALDFTTVFQGAPMTANITLANHSTTDLVVEDVDVFHTDAFSIQDTAFVIAAGGSRTLTVSCNPGQNVNYSDWLLVKSSSHPEVPHARIVAIGKYSDPYYDATQNLWNEDLKAAISATITAGAIQLTYNESRDQMYMIIDNQRVNGQGAAANTLECVYTGFLAVGYTSRTDAQNTFGLNTEHTMPQSLFNSTLPELSDLHHIFVTTGASNTERANKPFGTVTNPTWSVGGSKSNSGLFEPRDQQKGASIRALLYFLFRYQDYQGFICGMQTTLRDWHNQYPPDSIERRRNDAIMAFQHNRNPFVDHPEFMQRIASLCSVDNGNQNPVADWVDDTLQFGSVGSGNTRDGFYAVANHGINALNLSNLSVNGPEFTLTGATSYSIPKDSIALIPIRFAPSGVGQQYSAQLTFTTDDPTASSRTVTLMGNSILNAIGEPSMDQQVKIWPNPTHGDLSIELPIGGRQNVNVGIWNLSGQLMRRTSIPKGDLRRTFSIAGLPQGVYILKIERDGRTYSQKLLVE